MLAANMVNAKAMNYLSHRSHWKTAARVLGSGVQSAQACEVVLPLTRQPLMDALAWLAFGVLCVLASGTVAWLGVIGLVDLLRSWSTPVSHAMQVVGIISLGVLLVSAGVVDYFVSKAEDEPV